MMLPDTGLREHFEGGAVREPATGKGRYDLISPIMLARLARHYENGADKYAERNWEKGLSDSRCFDSAQRHLWSWMNGDIKEDHLAAAIWNIAAIMHLNVTQPKSPQRDLPCTMRRKRK